MYKLAGRLLYTTFGFVSLNATVLSDLELHITELYKNRAALRSGGSRIMPMIYTRNINYDLLNNYLYLYSATWPILLSGII